VVNGRSGQESFALAEAREIEVVVLKVREILDEQIARKLAQMAGGNLLPA